MSAEDELLFISELEIDSGGDQASSCGGKPCGPSGIRGVFDWQDQFLSMLSGSGMQNVFTLCDRGIDYASWFTGIDCAGVALAYVFSGVEDYFSDGWKCGGIHIFHSAEKDPMVREIPLSYTREFKSKHFYSDVLEKHPLDVVQEAYMAQAIFKDQYQQMIAAGKAKSVVISGLQKPIAQSLMLIFSKSECLPEKVFTFRYMYLLVLSSTPRCDDDDGGGDDDGDDDDDNDLSNNIIHNNIN